MFGFEQDQGVSHALWQQTSPAQCPLGKGATSFSAGFANKQQAATASCAHNIKQLSWPRLTGAVQHSVCSRHRLIS